VIVRLARKGERLRLLNGQEIDLAPDILLIADEEKPLALGGVMGGDASAVTDSTTEIFLESAFFDPTAIAGRTRRLALASDAAHRFERGVDFAITVDAIERSTQLILDICGGVAGPVSEAIAALPQRNAIRLRSARAGKVIGVPFSDDEIAALLNRMRLQAARAAGEFSVTPPSHRFDLEIEEDLIEEVARLYGYDNIPTRPPKAELAMLPDPERSRSVAELKRTLVEREYFEVISFSFVDAQWERDFSGNAEPIALENPIAAQFDVLRSNLVGSLVASLRFNLARKLDRVRIFEAGRCFRRSSEQEDEGDPARAIPGYHQPMRLGGLAFGPAAAEQWGTPTRRVDFYDVKADIEALLVPRRAHFAPLQHPALHPGRAAGVSVGGSMIGWVGELHPRWQQKYDLPLPPVLFELDVQALSRIEKPQYLEISKFPPVVRDLAVVVAESAPVEGLLEAMSQSRPAAVQDIRLFDVYRGKGIEHGKKSLAFRVVMQDTAKTLTDAEADAAMAQLTELLASKFGARLRT
jgi:phenylalanyl-tRNA synthetase beta chain